MSGFLFFMLSNRCNLETYQQKQNNLCITDMSENKTNNFKNTRARYGLNSFENTQRITDPSEASNNFFFCRKTSYFNGSCNVTLHL